MQLMLSCGRRQSGFTYIGLLLFIAISGFGLAAVGEMWHTTQKRAREEELLHIGDAYRKAIARYYEKGPGVIKQYPAKLEELVKDDRFPKAAHHLRKLYRDPISGREDWGIVRTPDNRIMGIYSLSEERPLNRATFRGMDQGFAGKVKYADWKFIYVPGMK